MKINAVSSFNNTHASYFGANIEMSPYLVQGTEYVRNNGNLNEKAQLINYLNQIKNDKEMKSFRIQDVRYNYPQRTEEIYVLTDGVAMSIDKCPLDRASKSGKGKISSRKYFLKYMGDFISMQYGKDTQTVLSDKKPGYVKTAQAAVAKANKKLNAELNGYINTFA